jgi:hypothetical protein
LLTELGFASEKQKQIPCGNDRQERQTQKHKKSKRRSSRKANVKEQEKQGPQQIPFGNDRKKSRLSGLSRYED